MPLTKESWTAPAIASTACCGVPAGAGGAMPSWAAWLRPSLWDGSTGGSPAFAQLPGSTSVTLAAISAPSTAVPRLPPTCIADCWRPPATPDSSIGALPTMTSVAPTMTGLMPRPIRTNQSAIAPLPEPESRVDMPNIATVVISMPATIGIRGPSLPIAMPATGEPTIIMPVIGSRWTPAWTGVIPCTFCR